jgi:ABC-type transport system involved in multi-copper enzyme maturation permease subunit
MNQMHSILILAKLNASEWIRLKFFHIIIFFGLVFIAFSHLLSSLTFSVQERLLYDFGLAGLELGLIVISSLIGSHSIQREIDRKTLFVLLSRPIPRSNVVLGFWLSIVILCFLFSSGFLLSLIFSSAKSNYNAGLVLATYSTFLKAMVVSSFAIACGLLVRPILALGATLCYWVLCYSITDIEFFVSKLQDDNLVNVIKNVKIFLPEFYRYNWKSYYYLINTPSNSEIWWATFHSLAWVSVWLFLASLFFRRKEIV